MGSAGCGGCCVPPVTGAEAEVVAEGVAEGVAVPVEGLATASLQEEPFTSRSGTAHPHRIHWPEYSTSSLTELKLEHCTFLA